MESHVSAAFKVLGMEPTEDIQLIRENYQDLIKVWHPDRFRNDEKLLKKAEEQMKEINAAYDNLVKYIFELKAQEYKREDFSIEPPRLDTKTSEIPAESKVTEEKRIEPFAPWRRYFARMLDMALYGVIVSGVIIAIDPYLLVKLGLWSFVLLAVLPTLVIEPLLFNLFGTTLGKKILGIRVAYMGNELTAKQSFYRTFIVLLKGNWLFIPIIPYVYNYLLLKKNRITSWDKELGLQVQVSRITSKNIVALVCCFLLVGFANATLGYVSERNIAQKYDKSPMEVTFLDIINGTKDRNSWQVENVSRGIPTFKKNDVQTIFSFVNLQNRTTRQYRDSFIVKCIPVVGSNGGNGIQQKEIVMKKEFLVDPLQKQEFFLPGVINLRLGTYEFQVWFHEQMIAKQNFKIIE